VADNRGVVYLEPGQVEVPDLGFPEPHLKDGPGVPDNPFPA
jgi:glutathione-independent formaldehyde dehydrogenase